MIALKVSTLAFIAAVFISCDCLQHIQCVVIDSETQLPIDKVIVKDSRDSKIGRDWVIYTDSLGKFEFTAMTGGIFGCPKLFLSFEKEGYDKKTKKYKHYSADEVVVVLEKQTK